ncbi:hypothetical protein [Bifidobacterium apri]|nr:hypothetical protein [Bifidobacterium apri]
MTMETMLDRQINSAEHMKSTTECIIDDVESNADILGNVLHAAATASVDTRPALELLDLMKKTASKAMELHIQAIADSELYVTYKLDQQEDDTEDEEAEE